MEISITFNLNHISGNESLSNEDIASELKDDIFKAMRYWTGVHKTDDSLILIVSGNEYEIIYETEHDFL